MKKRNLYSIQRFCWYGAGLVLFFAPFALYQKTLLFLAGSERFPNIHTMCLRTPLLYIANGNFNHILTISFFSFMIVLAVAFVFGPFFCGRFCATGALPEYLSRVMPRKWKIDWYQTVNPTPIRYGFLVGFLLSPLLGGTIAHAYCNFNLTEKLIYAGIERDIGMLTSTTIITAFLWLGLFGLMTKGGRGFCNFLCPVGALQSIVHSIGARFDFTYKIQKNSQQCTGCQVCVEACPMGSWQGVSITHEIHNCITCRQCESVCPTGAISFSRGKIHGQVKEDVVSHDTKM